MTSFNNQRRKLMKKIMEWPESRKHEQAPGMDMTWWQLAVRMRREKKVSKIKALVRRAEEVGLIG